MLGEGFGVLYTPNSPQPEVLKPDAGGLSRSMPKKQRPVGRIRSVATGLGEPRRPYRAYYGDNLQGIYTHIAIITTIYLHKCLKQGLLRIYIREQGVSSLS